MPTALNEVREVNHVASFRAVVQQLRGGGAIATGDGKQGEPNKGLPARYANRLEIRNSMNDGGCLVFGRQRDGCPRIVLLKSQGANNGPPVAQLAARRRGYLICGMVPSDVHRNSDGWLYMQPPCKQSSCTDFESEELDAERRA